MIKLLFELGNEIVIVMVEDNNVSFANYNTNYSQFVPIDKLRLNVQGILKEFPDLKDIPEKDAHSEAIFRFKQHIKTLRDEDKIKDYVTNEFQKMGYTLKSIKRNGFRPINVGG